MKQHVLHMLEMTSMKWLLTQAAQAGSTAGLGITLLSSYGHILSGDLVMHQLAHFQGQRISHAVIDTLGVPGTRRGVCRDERTTDDNVE